MSLKRRLTGALAALSMALAGAAPAAADTVLDDIRDRGTMRVGLSTFVPWAMRDKEGNLIGFEVDVATKAAEDLGVQVEFVPTAWSGIIPALIAGKFDVIIAGMSITPERAQTVDFTIPYAHSGQQMASNTELAADLETREDYNSPDVTITCRRGATPCTAVREMFPLATLRQFDDDAQAFQEVLNGNAHAVMSSAPKPAYMVEENPDILFRTFNGENLTEGDEAIALRKGDAAAVEHFSNWIRDNEDWIKERHAYWFDSRAAWADRVEEGQ